MYPAATEEASPHGRCSRSCCGRLTAMDLDDAADELYGVPPEKFVSARDLLVKEARQDGDPELAAQIKSLRKPTMAAWLANAMVREHPDEVGGLLDLGREMRAVLADLEPDELRELTRQRHTLVSALVQQATTLARSLGYRVTDPVATGLRSTLEATLADPHSADALAAGRLTDVLAVSGFGPGAGAPRRPQDGAAAPATVTPLSAAPSKRDKEQRAAERVLRDAETQSARARKALDAAGQALERARQAAADALDRVAELREQLTSAEAEAAERSTEAERAQQACASASEAVESAEQRREQAQQRLSSLTPH